jgi:methyltransferase (TIGR00027 family)
MREGQGSRTAEYNLLFRALETALPARRRLFDDPFARDLLGTPLRLAASLGRVPGVREGMIRYIDGRWPGVRTSVTARTRLIDDMIAGSVSGRVEQVVVLGAGFDTRAYRLPALADMPVFEVDHPDTGGIKQRMLARVLPARPAGVRFVAHVFGRDDLSASMAKAGYRESARTFFLWEGVTNYLTDEAVDATLRWCAQAAPGSLLVFTYVHRDILVRPETFVGSRNLFASLERMGESFTFGLEPSELAGYLAARGLALESDTGCADYRARYYGSAAQRMHGHEFYRVALARVVGS